MSSLPCPLCYSWAISTLMSDAGLGCPGDQNILKDNTSAGKFSVHQVSFSYICIAVPENKYPVPSPSACRALKKGLFSTPPGTLLQTPHWSAQKFLWLSSCFSQGPLVVTYFVSPSWHLFQPCAKCPSASICVLLCKLYVVCYSGEHSGEMDSKKSFI